MMQIVPNTLQTDSGDQPDSSCLSQKQKIKGDLRSWSETPPPAAGCGQAQEGAPGGAETCLGFSVGGGGPWGGGWAPSMHRFPCSLSPAPGLPCHLPLKSLQPGRDCFPWLALTSMKDASLARGQGFPSSCPLNVQ